MLLATDLDELEQEKAIMWQLFAELMNFEPDFKFTAKELSNELDYSKSELNKLLFRLYLNKALLICGKAPNGATLYSLNKAFLRGEAFKEQ